MIRAAGVVIPAHDEEDLLPSCLVAVRRAARRLTVPVYTVVVADACTDRTAQRARDLGAAVVETGARNVGAARAAGMGRALQLAGDLDPGEVWLATTDADTLVPRCWLARQAEYAAQGWQAVAGTVTVADWTGHPPRVPFAFHQRYRAWRRRHPHVHGANLSFSGRAYLAAGGFKPLPTAEDHDLVNSLEAAGIPLLRTARIPVVTSARTQARAPSGFGWLLSTLATLGDDAAPTPQEESA